MKRTILLLASLLVLNGCVKTRAELRGETGDGGELQRQTNTQRRESRAAEQKEQKPPPPPAPKADEIDEQLRQMNGRVDAAENQITQLNAAHLSEKESVTKMAQAIDAKFLAYEEAIKKLEQQVAELSEQVNTKASAPATGGKTAAPKGRTAYDEGEELFTAKKWKDAIVQYQKYRDTNPKGKHYADATYKIGFCFQELKMKDEAKLFFDEVVQKFPGSKEAKKAAFRSKQLK